MRLSLILAILSSSCLYRAYHPGGIEPNVRPLKPIPYRVLGPGQAKASNFELFHFANVTGPSEIEAAIRDAVASKEGDELIEVRWYRERTVWVVGTVNVIYITGQVIKYETSP